MIERALDRIRPQGDKGRVLGKARHVSRRNQSAEHERTQKGYVIPAGTEVLACHW